MKISNIKIKNLKKIADLDIQIPESNRVICFVGENGSNKSTVLTYLYHMIRNTTKEKSPSDDKDLFYDNTYDISQEFDEGFLFVKVNLIDKGEVFSIAKASIDSYDALTKDTQDLLNKEFKKRFDGKSIFLNSSFRNNSKRSDIVKDNVLLYRPSNRFETPSCERLSDFESTEIAAKKNVLGRRKFPFRVESGIKQATVYILDVLLDFFIDEYNKKEKDRDFSLYEEFISVLKSIDSDFSQLNISRFPNKSISSKNLPTLDDLSSGQSDWLITAINILIQIADIASSQGSIIKNPYEVTGIVLIDEIDKNYHPKLQEEIVPWFVSKYPGIQFILSTHSPYLIRSLGENSLIIRLPDGEVLSDDCSYWDLNEVASKVFGRDLGFSVKVKEDINRFKEVLRSRDIKSALEQYFFLSSKSNSLKQEINRISYTLGSDKFIEAINEKS